VDDEKSEVWIEITEFWSMLHRHGRINLYIFFFFVQRPNMEFPYLLLPFTPSIYQIQIGHRRRAPRIFTTQQQHHPTTLPFFAMSERQHIVLSATFESDSPSSLVVFGAAGSYGVHKAAFKVIEVKFIQPTRIINFTIFEDRQDISIPLLLQFEY